ncbi:hypothetical protein SAMN05216480_10661 [Pustulibacterium marinum]|uniref:Uncharacterized protein n=1 Tax=Pustulibacterium marinum TaxID=1224947 RepID=A0A1I7GX18_9FLAO|nr:hypothetical protein [Pustulibacterium marinum]SFU52998.1 hypothetical protein SAMN05216480_10661 [Pustulibacterium marinum]
MKDTIQEFWDAVAYDTAYLRMATVNFKKTEPVVSYLMEILADVHPSLSFVIQAGSKELTMTITASGDPDAYLYVPLVVERAPKIKGLEVVAFTQPMDEKSIAGMKEPFELDDIRLQVNEMHFNFITLEKDEKGVLIIAFKEYFRYKNHPQLDEAIQYVLDSIIGEVLYNRYIDFFFLEMPEEEPGDMYLGNISQLPDFLASL